MSLVQSEMDETKKKSPTWTHNAFRKARTVTVFNLCDEGCTDGEISSRFQCLKEQFS